MTTPAKNPMAIRTKVAIYNHTNEEQGTVVDGEMVSIPAGDGMGGAGMRMVTERVALTLLETLPGKVSRVPMPIDPAILAAIERAPVGALRKLVVQLLEGTRPADIQEFLSPFPKETAGE